MEYARQPNEIDLSPLEGLTVIAIDGDSGAGKSYLAEELAQSLEGSHVEVDAFLEKNGAPYIEQINWQLLSGRLKNVSNFPVILEGVLLLDVLSELNVVCDYMFFAKGYLNGCWGMEHFIYSTNLPRPRLCREIAKYYRRERPWERANIVISTFVTPSGTN